MPIRQATIDDAGGINRLLGQLGYPGTEASIATALAEMLENPADFLLVWEEKSSSPAILGFLSLHKMRMIGLQSNYLQINYFVIDEQARGAAIGQQMEEEAVRIAGDNDCSHLALHCSADRTGAHRFYARQGYKESPKYLIKKL